MDYGEVHPDNEQPACLKAVYIAERSLAQEKTTDSRPRAKVSKSLEIPPISCWLRNWAGGKLFQWSGGGAAEPCGVVELSV